MNGTHWLIFLWALAAPTGAVAATPAGAPAQPEDAVRERLDKSPRHHEWVVVKSGERALHTFVAFPQATGKTTAVVVLHENKGLTDWVRGVADQLAEAGYIAIAPDLLSGAGPGGGKTSDFANADAAREAIYALAQAQVTADLDALADYARQLPAANGKVAVAGFCWGGGQSFRFATHRHDLAAAFVFYGAFAHSREELAGIVSPVHGFYGGNDARIGETLPATIAAMREAGKSFEPVTYEGAGHGFMRLGEDAAGSEADRKARTAAWERWKDLLKKL
jgi:carboxymethylenebutenolidase